MKTDRVQPWFADDAATRQQSVARVM